MKKLTLPEPAARLWLETREVLHNLGPVRDVYDVIRLSQKPETAGDLVAAYGLLDDERKQEIEWTWAHCDELYQDEAEKFLKLTEAPCTDLGKLGSNGADILAAHRVARVVIELHGDKVFTERKSRGGAVFTDETHIERTRALHARNGIEETLDASGLSSRIVMQRIAICRNEGRNGVIFDSGDPAPQDRFTGKNTSMKRHDTPAQAGVGKSSD